MYFSRKAWVWMARALNSQVNAWSGWRGRVFLVKGLGLDGWGLDFWRKSLVWMVVARASQEKSSSAG